jgi:hypothetical protein
LAAEIIDKIIKKQTGIGREDNTGIRMKESWEEQYRKLNRHTDKYKHHGNE